MRQLTTKWIPLFPYFSSFHNYFFFINSSPPFLPPLADVIALGKEEIDRLEKQAILDAELNYSYG